MVDWTTLGGFIGMAGLLIAFAVLMHHWVQTASKGLDAKLESHMGQVQGELKVLNARFDQVDARFDRLEGALAQETAERRSDTRKLEGRIDELDQRIFFLATNQHQPPRRKVAAAA